MTTEFINSTNVGASQPHLRQLPAVTNNSETSSRSKTDNILRVDFQQRQEVADSSQVGANDIAANKLADGINDSVTEINSSSQMISRNLEFHIDIDSGRTVITVRDTKSNEVIRQIPSEQLLEISGRLKELQNSNNDNTSATGILFTSQT